MPPALRERSPIMSRAFGACVAALLTVTLHASNGLVPPSVPAGLEPPADARLFLRAHAVGTQNYVCAPAATASGADWFFLGPQATLFDDDLTQIGTHFLRKNPFQSEALQANWQSRASSAVWATRVNGSTDPAYVSADAIEWLLLGVSGAQAGPDGGERWTRARFVQRVHTVGGKKPAAAECTPATFNARRFVDYEADYYFYR